MAVLGFYFPPESGEKVTLEITILMSLTFFMNVVSDMQPPSSETHRHLFILYYDNGGQLRCKLFYIKGKISSYYKIILRIVLIYLLIPCVYTIGLHNFSVKLSSSIGFE